MNNTQIFITILAIMAATLLTRFLPFLVFSKNKQTPKYIVYLGKALPCAAIALLVVFCFKDISFSAAASWAPMLIAGGVTAALHFWRGNTLLSIGAGTILYMLLVQLVF